MIDAEEIEIRCASNGFLVMVPHRTRDGFIVTRQHMAVAETPQKLAACIQAWAAARMPAAVVPAPSRYATARMLETMRPLSQLPALGEAVAVLFRYDGGWHWMHGQHREGEGWIVDPVIHGTTPVPGKIEAWALAPDQNSLKS